MKAIRVHEYGEGASLQYEDAPDPRVAEGEILVRVKAAGVNPIDLKSVSGFLGQSLPMTPGWDISGTIESLGPETQTALKPGDDVFAMLPLAGNGGYAEYAISSPDHIARKPASLDHVHAAAVPLAGLTALKMIEVSGTAFGARILVLGATGGVGSFAVQIAKIRDAEVIGGAEAPGHEFVRSLGADSVVVPLLEGAAQLESVDAILDTVGDELQGWAWSLLKPEGTMISIRGDPLATRPSSVTANGARVFVEPNGAELTALAGLIDQGKITVPIDAVYPLSEAADAHNRLRERGRRGKIVLEVSHSTST